MTASCVDGRSRECPDLGVYMKLVSLLGYLQISTGTLCKLETCFVATARYVEMAYSCCADRANSCVEDFANMLCTGTSFSACGGSNYF